MSFDFSIFELFWFGVVVVLFVGRFCDWIINTQIFDIFLHFFFVCQKAIGNESICDNPSIQKEKIVFGKNIIEISKYINLIMHMIRNCICRLRFFFVALFVRVCLQIMQISTSKSILMGVGEDALDVSKTWLLFLSLCQKKKKKKKWQNYIQKQFEWKKIYHISTENLSDEQSMNWWLHLQCLKFKLGELKKNLIKLMVNETFIEWKLGLNRRHLRKWRRKQKIPSNRFKIEKNPMH